MRRHHHNGLKTFGLFAVMWAVLLGAGALLAMTTRSPGIIWLFAALGLIGTFVSYWRSDTIAVRAMNAFPVSEAEAPVMHRIVRELADRAKQPMPRLYVSPTDAPNAFATGRSPRRAVVCCTSGILQILDERELRGVLAHELMHVYNRDILTSSVAAAMSGLLTSAAQFLLLTGGRSRGANPLALVGTLLMALLAPLGAAVIQMAISRTREFDADAGGAALSGDPLALADALRKISDGAHARPLRPEGDLVTVAPMMIANPFRGAGLARMFATHPPMRERVARLEALAMR
ncbi:zinc metalloprotease HtpX [Pseudactinotalea suaedae]|uniref:zinc metalloprotease HtpX n=1 Tax=Pseudactinotalea suaedae TaxID=1524924 RepID=UPI0012E1EE07|nr:zinc metalloprotease HtpX [Pseudactinotalea suaedae]